MRYLVLGLSLIIASTPAHANRVTAVVEGAKLMAKLATPKVVPKAAITVVHPPMPSTATAKGIVTEKSTTDKAAEKLSKLKDVGEVYDSACMRSAQHYDSKKCAPVKAVRNTVNAPRKADRK
jgi:hypothetical protein